MFSRIPDGCKIPINLDMKAQNCLFQFLNESLPGPSKIPTVHYDHVPQVPRSPDDWSLVTDGLVTSGPHGHVLTWFTSQQTLSLITAAPHSQPGCWW